MAFFTRNRRNKRLVDELLTQVSENRELRANRLQLLAEAQQLMELINTYRDLPDALCKAVDQLTVANEDLRQIETRHHIRRPSHRIPPMPVDDFAALWRGLPDPH